LPQSQRGIYNDTIDDPFFNSTSKVNDSNTNYMLSADLIQSDY